jgi:hypothetical protein
MTNWLEIADELINAGEHSAMATLEQLCCKKGKITMLSAQKLHRLFHQACQTRYSTRYPIGAIAAAILLAFQATALATPAKLSPEAVIDQIFRSDSLLPGETQEERQNLIQAKSQVVRWLGTYQGVRPENGRSIILFERGWIPVTVQFKENGDPKSLSVSECPTTSVPIRQAPSVYQPTLLESCPNLTP